MRLEWVVVTTKKIPVKEINKDKLFSSALLMLVNAPLNQFSNSKIKYPEIRVKLLSTIAIAT